MENFKTQSFSIAAFESLGVTVGSIFAGDVMLRQLAENVDLAPSVAYGIAAGGVVGLILAKAGPLVTGSLSAAFQKQSLSSDIADSSTYNDIKSWGAGAITGIFMGLCMTSGMNANFIEAYNLEEKFSLNIVEDIKLEAHAQALFENLRPA